LRTTVSYDVPIVSSVSAPMQRFSVDHSVDAKRLETDIVQTTTTWNPPPGISSSVSEPDNQETNAWSSDYSNSEDEYTILDDGAVPVSH
jgi:hypothetical protein